MKTKIFISIFFLTLLFMLCSEKKGKPDSDTIIDMPNLKAKFAFKGRIVFQSDMDGDREIYLLTAGGIKNLTNNSWDDEYPKWSPDGGKISYSANPTGNYDIFIMDEDGSSITQITTSKEDEVSHAWFPDGEKIAYTIEEKKGFVKRSSLWMVDLELKEKTKIIPQFRGHSALPDFSPASPIMGFTGKKTFGWDVYIYDMQLKEYKGLTKGGKSCRSKFSPDGGKIAYVSSEADGKGDIWLMSQDGSRKERLTERNETSDYFPSWSPDEKYIVFSSSLKHRIDRGNWSLYLVKVKTKRIIPLFDSPGRDVFPDWK